MDHLRRLALFVDAIVNPNRSVKEFSDAGPSHYGRADMRELGKKIYVIEKSIPESLSRCNVVLADELQNLV
jgi:hypothetical protein